MQCTILASGSKGNCMLVEGAGGALLIDAGLSAKEIMHRLASAGKRPDEIHAILVTHEHGDHIAGVDVLSRQLHIPICATEGTLRDFLVNRRTSNQPVNTRTCQFNVKFSIQDFVIEPFATSHDANEPCGFCIREDGFRLGYCTDTGIVNSNMVSLLQRCDGLVLESNHCPVMLKNGPYPEYLKRRIRSVRGHLSNEAAARCLRTVGSSVQTLILAHVSVVNNTPEKVRLSARDGLGLLYDEKALVVATQEGTSHTCPQVLRL
ncbi:MAG: MBL fold metallo-hydrolase [Methanoregula sp.]|nr:MBL fold metallo-hydrolase [Methanoregula sp.]